MSRHLRILANTLTPWIRFKNGLDHDCEGIQCDLIKYLSRSLNFTYQFIEQRVGTGHKLPNGTYTGVIGKIQQDVADLSGFPIVVTVEPILDNIIDQTTPFFVEESVVMIKYDNCWSSLNFSQLMILDNMSWTIFAGLFIYLITTIVFLHEYLLVQKERLFQRLSSVMLDMFGTLLQIDIWINRIFIIRISTLILMTSWLIGSMQLSMVISSEVTARLSLKIPNKQIETLAELVETEMHLVVYPTFMALHHIPDRNVFRKFKRKIEQDHSVIPIQDFFRNKSFIVNTSEGGAAMFFGAVPLKTIAIIHSKHLKPNTKFHFISESCRAPFLYTIGSNPRLPKKFRKMLNNKVIQYTSTGIINKQIDHILVRSDRFFDVKESVNANYNQINMDNLLGLFRLILMLSVICLILNSLEILVYLSC